MMPGYKIPREVARLVAVGIYRDVGAFVKAANPADLQRFRAEYVARQAAHAAPPVKRQSRKK